MRQSLGTPNCRSLDIENNVTFTAITLPCFSIDVTADTLCSAVVDTVVRHTVHLDASEGRGLKGTIIKA